MVIPAAKPVVVVGTVPTYVIAHVLSAEVTVKAVQGTSLDASVPIIMVIAAT